MTTRGSLWARSAVVRHAVQVARWLDRAPTTPTDRTEVRPRWT